MENQIIFRFEGKLQRASTYISLQDDLKVVFVILKDQDLIKRFGDDIDFQIENENVKPIRIFNTKLEELQTTILDSVKILPEYLIQNSLLDT